MLVGVLLAASLAWPGTPAMAAARSWTIIAGGATRD